MLDWLLRDKPFSEEIPMPAKSIEIEREGDVLVLVLRGDLSSLQWANRPDLLGQVDQAFAGNQRRRLVVDLSELTAGGAGLMTVLILLWKKVAQQGGSMVLVSVPAWFRLALRAVKLDAVWETYATLVDAVPNLDP